jgi:CubicO group peptidase (beta-lactamase class C family)
MKHFLRLTFLCFFLLIIISCSTTQKSEEIPSLEEKAQINADTIVSNYAATSVQYALIDHGTIVLSGSSGVFDASSGRPVTKDDMYGIGSTSKMFATAALMMLWDQGKIDLDTSVSTYLPSFTMADERYKDITVRMLLNHSSGLNGSNLANAFLFDDNNTIAHDTLLKHLASQRLKADPGEFSEYCNDGFTLAELLIEHISGMKYSEFIAKHFSQPLGLENTKTPLDDFDKANRIAKVYLPQYELFLPNDTVNVLGTGGLYSTAEDLCTFAQVLMGTKPEILSRQAAQMMQEEEYKKGMWPEYSGDNFFAFGLGWDSVHSHPFSTYALQALSKGGDTQLSHSSLIVIPELEIAIAVVSSGSSSAANYMLGASILEKYLLEKGHIKQIIEPTHLPSPPEQKPMPAEYTAYSGLYVDGITTVQVDIHDGILEIKPLHSDTVLRYIYIGEQLFQAEGGENTIKFSLQTDGNLYLQANRLFTIPEVAQLWFISLSYQKIETIHPDPVILEAWSDRAGKKYYPINEIPTSQTYFLLSHIQLNDNFDSGYAFGGAKIIEENLAVNTVKFRDVGDLILRMHEGSEYLYWNDSVYIREDFIPTLTTATTHCIITDDEFAKYYVIGESVQGKTMVVDMPEGAAFAVYDENDTCLHFTTVTKSNTAQLPQKGKIVLIGYRGDRFDLVFHD